MYRIESWHGWQADHRYTDYNNSYIIRGIGNNELRMYLSTDCLYWNSLFLLPKAIHYTYHLVCLSWKSNKYLLILWPLIRLYYVNHFTAIYFLILQPSSLYPPRIKWLRDGGKYGQVSVLAYPFLQARSRTRIDSVHFLTAGLDLYLADEYSFHSKILCSGIYYCHLPKWYGQRQPQRERWLVSVCVHSVRHESCLSLQLGNGVWNSTSAEQ